MSEWQELELGDLVNFVNGDRSSNYPKISDNESSGVPFVSASEIGDGAIDFDRTRRISATSFEKLRTGKFVSNDILLCIRGSIGKIARVPAGAKGAIASSLVIIRSEYPEIQDYVYHFLRSSRSQYYLKGLDNGSAQPNLSVRLLSKTPIHLPPRPQLSEIVKLLNAIDERINLNWRTNQTLEAMARAIFKDWFVDFGPVRAKMEGRDPYLSPEIWDLFPHRFDEEGTPEGWTYRPAAELIEFNPKESLRNGELSPHIDMSALPVTGPNPQPFSWKKFSSGTKFRNRDTLFARITPCLENGKTAFVQNLPSDVVGWGSTEFIVLRSKAPVPPEFTYLLARNEAFRNLAKQSMTGTSGRQRARTEALKVFEVVSVPEKVWGALGSVVRPMFEKIAKNQAECETIGNVRDLLLPKLMSGEVSIRDAEREVEEVV